MLYPINVRTKFSVLPLCITRQLLYNYKRYSVHNLHQLISGYYTESCHNTPPVTVTKEYKTYKRIIKAWKKGLMFWSKFRCRREGRRSLTLKFSWFSLTIKQHTASNVLLIFPGKRYDMTLNKIIHSHFIFMRTDRKRKTVWRKKMSTRFFWNKKVKRGLKYPMRAFVLNRYLI